MKVEFLMNMEIPTDPSKAIKVVVDGKLVIDQIHVAELDLITIFREARAERLRRMNQSVLHPTGS